MKRARITFEAVGLFGEEHDGVTFFPAAVSGHAQVTYSPSGSFTVESITVRAFNDAITRSREITYEPSQHDGRAISLPWFALWHALRDRLDATVRALIADDQRERGFTPRVISGGRTH